MKIVTSMVGFGEEPELWNTLEKRAYVVESTSIPEIREKGEDADYIVLGPSCCSFWSIQNWKGLNGAEPPLITPRTKIIHLRPDRYALDEYKTYQGLTNGMTVLTVKTVAQVLNVLEHTIEEEEDIALLLSEYLPALSGRNS